MNASDNGLKLIQSFEGCRLAPYLDLVKVPTIGWGSTAYEDGTPVTMHDPAISQSRADGLFRHTIKPRVDELNHVVAVKLTQNQFDALLSFVYNLGIGALKKSTLLRLLNQSNYMGAAAEFSKWTMAGGHPVPGLVKRREREMALFISAH